MSPDQLSSLRPASLILIAESLATLSRRSSTLWHTLGSSAATCLRIANHLIPMWPLGSYWPTASRRSAFLQMGDALSTPNHLGHSMCPLFHPPSRSPPWGVMHSVRHSQPN